MTVQALKNLTMKLLLSILLFMTSAVVASNQANSQAGNPPATPQQAGAPPSGQQPAAAGAPQPNAGSVASTLHVYAYPNGTQSHEQQSKDEAACYQSAQSATAGSSQSAAQSGQQGQPSDAGKGSTVKGSAGGAATGAAIGAVAGDAGQGAAIGAVGGAAVGRRKKKKAQQEAQQQQQQQQQQQAQQAQATDDLKRAYTACMQSRNYTVK